jgi:hypothetical protein
MLLLSFALLLSALVSVTAQAATYTAASCNRVDVNACINNDAGGSCSPTRHTAVDGDVIQIPAGSCTWSSSGITVPPNIGITIQGNGTPDSTEATFAPSSSCASGTTIILSGVAGFQTSPIYGNSTTRISCMTLQASGSGMAFAIRGTCSAGGCPSFRADNITFTGFYGISHLNNGYGVTAIGDMFGVFDHNTITGTGTAPYELAEIGHGSYLGHGQYGDYSWAQPESWGTANFVFFENNTFTNASCCENESAILNTPRYGGNGGPRIVVRYNNFTTAGQFALGYHGTESSGRTRGGRTFEFYGNTVMESASSAPDSIVAPRSGNGLVWGNTNNKGSGASLNYWLKFQTQRTIGNSNTSWGPCDGSSVYDINDVTPSSPAFDGTISSVSGAGVYAGFDLTLSCSPSCGWTANQWSPTGAPYSIHDITQGGSEGTGSEIQSSTANTVHVVTNLGQSGSWIPATGDHVQILRARACIDEAGGRGAGYYYSNTVPATPAVSSAEALSRSYEWSNTFTGGAPGIAQMAADNLRVIQNRDYYTENMSQAVQSNATTPFDGSTSIGMGHGPLNFRPVTCTSGVGYWATDVANPQDANHPGVLYVCNPTNTWTSYYTPYTYPHPLTSESSTPPAPPSGLAATVN